MTVVAAETTPKVAATKSVLHGERQRRGTGKNAAGIQGSQPKGYRTIAVVNWGEETSVEGFAVEEPKDHCQ